MRSPLYELAPLVSSVDRVFQQSPRGTGPVSSSHTTAQRKLTRRTPTRPDDPLPLQQQAISRGWPSAPTRPSQRAGLNQLRMASASPDAPASRDSRPRSSDGRLGGTDTARSRDHN